MVKAIKVTFNLLIEDEWLNVDDCLNDVAGYVCYVQGMARVLCCSLQAGFFIEVEGSMWNGPSFVGEFQNAETWIRALEEMILEGKIETRVWAWKESDCRLERIGDVLIMEDRYHSDRNIFYALAYR